jgi:predicted aspartyl protease
LIVEADPDEPGCATVRVDAQVGVRTYRFVLDTGAARTGMLADAWVAGLPSDERHTANAVFAAITEDIVVLPSVTLGPLVVANVRAARAAAGKAGDNLLGMDVLGGAAIRIDLDGAEVGVESSGALPTAWPLDRSQRGHPFVELRWGDAAGRAVFDTGASITLMDTAFLAEHPSQFTYVGMTKGTDAAGVEMTTDLYQMDTVTIGDREFTPTRVAVVDLPQNNGRMDFVLGYPVIRQAVWAFDFPANRWGFITD